MKNDPISKIIARVAEQSGISVRELIGPGRTRYACEARASVAWVIRTLLPSVSLVTIGQRLGGRDHTTVMNSLARAADRIAMDAAYAATLTALVAELAPTMPTPLAVTRPPARSSVRAGTAWWVRQSVPWCPLAA